MKIMGEAENVLQRGKEMKRVFEFVDDENNLLFSHLLAEI